MVYKCVREERRLRRYRLPKRMLKKLPIFKYSKSSDLAYSTCVICLEEFVEGDKLRILPCKHRECKFDIRYFKHISYC